MSQLVFLSLTFAAVVSCLMALRMYGDWISITACGSGCDPEPLSSMKKTLECWVYRHLTCAVAATVLSGAVRLVPSFDAFPGADALIAGYGVLSLLFASLDHALSQQVDVALKQIGSNRG